MITTLDIFDFDGTLFDSPAPPSGYPGKGWWDAEESLQPPCVPQRPPTNWYLSPAKNALKRASSDPARHPVVVTGRIEPHRSRVAEILRSGGLQPAELFLNPGTQTPSYKVATLRYLAKMLRHLRDVEVWEDNRHNLAALEKAANKLGLRFEGHLVRHKPRPAVCPIPSRVASQYAIRTVLR